MRTLLNKNEDEIVGKHCYELMHGTTTPPDFCPLDKMYKSRKRESATLELGGRYYKITTDPILDEDKSIRGIIHILRDVDESERKSRLAEESIKKYTELVETMFDVSFTLDFEGLVVDTSSSIERITGRPKEQNIGLHFSDYVFPDDLEIAESEFVRAIQGKGHPIEIRIIPKEGTPRWAKINALLTMRNGEPEDLLCVLSDIHEKKLAEDILMKNQALLKETMKIAKMGGWEIDLDTMTQKWTDETFNIMEERTAAGSPEISEGMRTVAEWCRPMAERALKRAIEFGEPFDQEWEVVTSKGNRCWVRTIGKPNIVKGKLKGVSGSFQDITDQKQSEFMLMDAEGKYHSLFENMLDGFAYCRMIYDDSGRPVDFIIEKVNRAFDKLSGMKDVIGKKISDLIPGIRETNSEMFDVFSRVVKTGGTEKIDIEIKQLSIWLTFAVYRPEPGHFIAIFSNFTERKIIENELTKKTAEAMQRSFELDVRNKVSEALLSYPDEEMFPNVIKMLKEVTGSKYGIFGYLDQDGNLVIPSMTQMVWEYCQIPGKTSVLPRERLIDCSWSVALQEKRTVIMNEPTITLPNGNIRIARHISIPLIEKDEIIGLIQVANKDSNYTKQDFELLNAAVKSIAPVLSARLKKKIREDELKAYRENLEKIVAERTSELKMSNEELESFVYSVSHDLRAPLRSIDGFSQAVMEDYADKLDAQGQDYLNLIRDSTQRMAKLIDEMLMLSRITRAELKVKPVNLSLIADNISKELRENQPQRKVDFVIEPHIEVNGDRDLMRILMENLIGNAWKFTSKHDSARIEIGQEKVNGWTTIFVRDDGAGFDMKYVDKLFIPFQRLHSVSEFTGSGVGLATVQRIVNKHGGKIWAEGAVEKGAVFHFIVG